MIPPIDTDWAEALVRQTANRRMKKYLVIFILSSQGIGGVRNPGNNTKITGISGNLRRVDRKKIPPWQRRDFHFLWEHTGSNRGPSACKADALNQLSYAPVFIEECKDKRIGFAGKLFLGKSNT